MKANQRGKKGIYHLSILPQKYNAKIGVGKRL